MTNRTNGTLYVGVTSDLARRAWEHAERHEDIRSAIQREKNLKHWPRAWKVNLILADNPDWDDLYARLA